ncbi:unnamed protein product [Urochloa humidicola]
MASSISSDDDSSTNPFFQAPPVPIAAASVNLINIRSHVPVILDFDEANYAQWSAFLDNTLLKFGLIDHIDGTVDAQLRLHDAEWTQIDHCVVSWLYSTVSKGIMDTVFQPRRTAFSLWTAIRNLFLDNAMHRAVDTLQEFHSLFQGDMPVNDYCTRLKKLSDILRDVGHPVSDAAMVVNALRGLNSKFHSAISVISAQRPPPDFASVRSYLHQEERHMANRHKMEAATALLTAGSSSSSTSTLSSSSTFSPTKPASDKKKKRKQSDGRNRNVASTPSLQSTPSPQQQPWGTSYNPWTGVVQAWSMPQWRAPSAGVLGPRPGANHALTATYNGFPGNGGFSNFPQMQQPAPPQLFAALQGVPSPATYSGGGDWFFDTGASTHMASNPGSSHQDSSSPM